MKIKFYWSYIWGDQDKSGMFHQDKPIFSGLEFMCIKFLWSFPDFSLGKYKQICIFVIHCAYLKIRYPLYFKSLHFQAVHTIVIPSTTNHPLWVVENLEHHLFSFYLLLSSLYSDPPNSLNTDFPQYLLP
jgi:hypothetical protein